MVGAEMISSLFLFPFPFYGHELTEFYITTHGFLSLTEAPRLYLQDAVHRAAADQVGPQQVT